MHSRDNKHSFNSTKDFLPRHYISLRSKLFLDFLFCTRVHRKFIGTPKIILMMMMASIKPSRDTLSFHSLAPIFIFSLLRRFFETKFHQNPKRELMCRYMHIRTASRYYDGRTLITTT